MKGVFYLFGILCFIYYTNSKPNGSPQDSCFYMTPRHINSHTFRRVFPTKAMGLYNITTSADVFRPDRPIRVTLWGPPFKGFMLVAAEEGAKDWPTGIFYSEDGDAKRISCLGRGDTVTHQNNSYKDSVSVLWYGPENMMSEQIQFIATVVVNLTIYYTNIRSGMLRLDPSIHAASAAGGEGGAPAAATMDPWLSGQSVTQAPAWGRGPLGGLGTGVGLGTSGGLGNTGWGGQYPAANNWGTNTGGAWGGQNTAAGGWGAQNTAGAGGWGNQNTGGSTWGSNSNNALGASGGTGGTGTSWGNGWQSQGQGQTANTWGGANTPNTGSGTANTGTGNSWNANGDWQQWGQGSVTSRTYIPGRTQWQNADGSSWNNGQKTWNAPGDGRAIWHWNSGKISSTPAPEQTPAPTQAAAGAAQGSSGSAWSANNLANLLQRLGLGSAV